jgi:uridylate kinase
MDKQVKYQRVLLKISGEALSGKSGFGLDINILKYLTNEIKAVWDNKVEIGIIVGGGNLFRGATLKEIARVDADQIGMLATVINALALRDVFEKNAMTCQVMSAFDISGVVEKFERRRALNYLSANKIVIFAGGTGNPLVTTDSALALRGIELEADLLLKATNVDGIYSGDPKIDSAAKLLKSVTYKEALQKELKIMDIAAFSLCRDYNKILKVFNLNTPQAFLKIVMGDDIGTLVSE